MKHEKTKFITVTQVLRTGSEDKSIKEVPTILNIEGIVYAMQTKLEVSGVAIIGQIVEPLVTRVFVTTGASFAVVESEKEINLMVQLAQAEDEHESSGLMNELDLARKQRLDANESQKAASSIIKP